MRILLTGFEPFNQSTTNPSQEVIKAFKANPPEGVDLCTAILPVEHIRGPEALVQSIEHNQPDAVVCLGEAGGVTGITLERIGVNLVDDTIPDNSGEIWVDRAICENSPAAYFATLPVKTMREAMIKAGVPAVLSMSAGTFLCNQILYTLMHTLTTRYTEKRILGGFIHLPRLPEQAAEAMKPDKPYTAATPSMSLEMQVRGIRAGLEVIKYFM